MKQKIKQLLKLIPGLLALRAWLGMRKMFFYDQARFLRYSSCSRENSREGLLALIIMTYHVVEKGLTMPDMRLGFGREMILGLIKNCNNFIDKYDDSEPQLRDAIAVVAEYKQVHEQANFALDEERSRAIDALLKRVPVKPSQQIEMTRERYFLDIDAPFEKFSASRHSVRNFAGTISEEQIRDAVALANNAPSACNRQYVRVHCVTDKKQIADCLALQNGNRGFGHLADKLLVVTTDLRCAWGSERNDLFTNAGIYIMNLCYALHKNKVAHCLLNWSVVPDTDLALRRVLARRGGGDTSRRKRSRFNRLWRRSRAF